MNSGHAVVIGAGVGGLTTAALLARAGLNVAVLEAHVYPGGCAGTFYHQGYRFDAGATLAAGFYPGGPMDLVAQAVGLQSWPSRPAHPAMQVHLPDGAVVTRWGNERRWPERRARFGSAAEPFWHWQERSADLLWDLALAAPPWPPQSAAEMRRLAAVGLGWLADQIRAGRADGLPALVTDCLRPLAAHLPNGSGHGFERLRLFVDGQLLIAAQTTSDHANALYAASALDLPRRGVVHFAGGMGAIAENLVNALCGHGGQIHYRQEAARIVVEQGRLLAVETKRGQSFPADVVVANLPPWNIARLFDGDPPSSLQNLPSLPADGWGAFTVYLGVDAGLIPDDFPLHHQVIAGRPLAEGHTVFVSISPAWDPERGPHGRRALTLSTHTRLGAWWDLFRQDREAYAARKAHYTERMLAAAEKALPGLREAAVLVLPGTPVTFQRFTRRVQGWVGGFPQTSLLRTWPPKLANGLWMVGDSIFPGQSTAAVALGGLRVADAILREIAGTAAVLAGRFVPSLFLAQSGDTRS